MYNHCSWSVATTFTVKHWFICRWVVKKRYSKIPLLWWLADVIRSPSSGNQGEVEFYRMRWWCKFTVMLFKLSTRWRRKKGSNRWQYVEFQMSHLTKIPPRFLNKQVCWCKENVPILLNEVMSSELTNVHILSLSACLKPHLGLWWLRSARWLINSGHSASAGIKALHCTEVWTAEGTAKWDIASITSYKDPPKGEEAL